MVNGPIQADLETILQRFEANKEIFRLPETISFEHPDITVKYLISMLGIAEEEKRKGLVDSFCDRLHADKEQMHRLLADQNRYADYLLYTAFSCHLQQQLEVDTDKFFKEVSDRTFLDYSDKQIAIARVAVTLPFVLKNMAKQFPNWSKVNRIVTRTAYATYEFDDQGKFRVKRNKEWRSLNLAELDDVTITRSTLPIYRERLKAVLGEEGELAVLKRDCDQTVYSFKSTFQGLFRQEDLEVNRVLSEGDGEEYSEYLMHPSAPYQSLIQKGLTAIGRGLISIIPVAGSLYWRSRYKLLEDEASQRKRIIADQGSELRELLAQLQRKQLTFLDFMKRVAGNNAIGPSHQMRGVMTRIYNQTERLVLEELSTEIADRYKTLEWSMERRAELTGLCSTFGLEESNLSHQEKIYATLKERLDVGEIPLATVSEDADPFAIDLGDVLTPTENPKVYFRQAYAQFLDRKSSLESFWDKFDPFRRIETLEAVAQGKDLMNRRLAEKVDLFESVRLSKALQEATEAVRKKGSLEVIPEIVYDPEFKVDHDTIVYWLADLLTNSLEHGRALQAKVVCYKPSERPEEELPFFKNFKFADYPVLYLRIEDNGNSVPLDIAERLNRYFLGDTEEEGRLSSRREGGGIGSRKARELLTVLDGRVHYEPIPGKGTNVHIYLGRLEL
ncbi:MAG: ATP-binding protein [Candidatus Woesearchaeota archaeon]